MQCIWKWVKSYLIGAWREDKWIYGQRQVEVELDFEMGGEG
jgi:hypothetical protein